VTDAEETAGGHPMTSAPHDREIECWNGFYGWYRTKFEDSEWPKRGEPNWPEGVWYPVPTFWREVING
jgi:hypothetical protein